jgi:hypothetical protein
LDKHINGILGVLTVPHPDRLANIEQYLLNIPTLFGALKAWEGELEEYTTSKDPIDKYTPVVPVVNRGDKKQAREIQVVDQEERDRTNMPMHTHHSAGG